VSVQVKTNNVPRDVIEGYELSPAEREEFDYIDWSAVERGQASPTFFRYKGELHDLGEFTVWASTPHDELKKWDGYRSDTFFSALVVRYVDDFERVIVGLVMS
jgi:hypothetical protein